MMITKHYRFAGLDFTVEMPEDAVYGEERNLTEFRSEPGPEPHRFVCDYVDVLPEPTGTLTVQQPNFTLYKIPGGHVRYIGGSNSYVRAEHRGKLHTVQVKKNPYNSRIGVKTLLESMEVEHLLARNDGFVFHCSYIERGGEAILFTAPSETGKSTQAELWKNLRGVEIINGDRAAIRLAEGVLLAEGIPFAGSSRYCKNRSLPIRAIVYLGQASQTTIRRLRGYEAFSKIWEGVSVNTWDREDLERVSAVVQKVAAEIPVYHMPCTPDETAVQTLEEALRKQVSL